MESILIKYHNDKLEHLENICGEKSDWVDLRAAEDVTMKKGEFQNLCRILYIRLDYRTQVRFRCYQQGHYLILICCCYQRSMIGIPVRLDVAREEDHSVRDYYRRRSRYDSTKMGVALTTLVVVLLLVMVADYAEAVELQRITRLLNAVEVSSVEEVF